MAKIQLKNVFVCENVIIAFDGKISLINIFSEIKAKGFPAINPRFTVLVSISGDAGVYDEVVEIISINDGKTLASTIGKAEIKGSGGNNFVATFINIPFIVAGKYWIKVSINGEVKTNENEHAITVQKID